MTGDFDPPLFMRAWVGLLRAHARAVAQVSRDLEARCGIPLTWFDVLFQLSCAPYERLRMHELAGALLLSKSGLTRLVDRIEEAGLVARAAIPGNRRSLHVQLTLAGRELQHKARPIVQEIVAEHFGRHLTDAELATLRDALVRIGRS
jgi:DNA-binding MarR family transcriptional regulator